MPIEMHYEKTRSSSEPIADLGKNLISGYGLDSSRAKVREPALGHPTPSLVDLKIGPIERSQQGIYNQGALFHG